MGRYLALNPMVSGCPRRERNRGAGYPSPRNSMKVKKFLVNGCTGIVESPYASNPGFFSPECDVRTVKANRKQFEDKLGQKHWFSFDIRGDAVSQKGAQRHDDIITDDVDMTRSQRVVLISLVDNSVGQERNWIRPVLLPPLAKKVGDGWVATKKERSQGLSPFRSISLACRN